MAFADRIANVDLEDERAVAAFLASARAARALHVRDATGGSLLMLPPSAAARARCGCCSPTGART